MKEIQWSEVPLYHQVIMMQISTGKEVTAFIRHLKNGVTLTITTASGSQLYSDYNKDYFNDDIKYFVKQ